MAEPGELKELGFKATAKVAQGPACEDFLNAHAAYLAYCARYREHYDHVLLRDLMAPRRHYDALKRDRSGLDFDDLELLTRDLLARDEGLRAAYRSVSRT